MYEEDLFSGYDPYKGMTDEERVKACLLHVISTAVGVIIVIMACALLGGCTTTKYVPVPEVHTEHHWHTDSVRQRDSTHTDRETIIREVDSAAMAKYGIQMESNQRAWLVLQREMENRLRELEHMTAQKDTVRDSIPVPYPVEVVKEVPRERSTVEWVLLITGVVAITFIVLSILIWIKKHT